MFGIKRITGAGDLADQGEPGSWVSDTAREKFMAAYDRVFALWPQPREEFDVETGTATTRGHAYRPVPARGVPGRVRPGIRDRHARRRKSQHPARPDDPPGILRGLAGRVPGQAQ